VCQEFEPQTASSNALISMGIFKFPAKTTLVAVAKNWKKWKNIGKK
jgi:hypothetical protein